MPRKKDELSEAVLAWERATKKRAKLNRDAKQGSKDAQEALEAVQALLGERGHEGVKVGGNLVSLYEHTHYYVPEAMREEFEKWAKTQDEEYLEPNRRVRGETLASQMQLREENGEGLPPGVQKYVEQKVSKRKAAKR